MSTTHATVEELADRRVGDAVTVRGKELPIGADVAAARAFFASSSVQLIPVLDGDAYVGAVTRDDLEGAADSASIAPYATGRTPTATASTGLPDAIRVLDADGGRRLVVLGDDGRTYVGLLCLDRDRTRLCIDAECHTPGHA